jgi:NADH-quinone oxidoreductase subunit J
MLTYFYINAVLAILSTTLAIIAKNAVHALLYFVVSLLALAISMYLLGAPFVAALEVIIYAGAIMVLFVFVVMLLNVKPSSSQRYLAQGHIKNWLGPCLLFFLLISELVLVFRDTEFLRRQVSVVSAKEVAYELFATYTLAVELTSFLLLAGLIGAYHVGKKRS